MMMSMMMIQISSIIKPRMQMLLAVWMRMRMTTSTKTKCWM
jgi:hypothetical protein